mgnify:CR=1 FL=1
MQESDRLMGRLADVTEGRPFRVIVTFCDRIEVRK